MVVKARVQKKKETKPVEEPSEELVDKFISGGGKTTVESKEESANEFVYFTMRVPKKIAKDMDRKRKEDSGITSRNKYILELICKDLKRRK